MSRPIFRVHLLKRPRNFLRLLPTFPAPAGRPCSLHKLPKVDAPAFLAGMLRYALTLALFLFGRALGF